MGRHPTLSPRVISRRLSGIALILSGISCFCDGLKRPKMLVMVLIDKTTLQNRVLQPSPHKLAPIKEITFYPAQFPILLRERMQGRTVGEAAAILEIPVDQFVRLLEGQWKPSKDICRRMGLRPVYAIADTLRSR